MKSKLALSLIELLVVIAILGTLALIVLPNVIEAQTRAKTARAKAELATLRTAVESYAVDNASYPMNSSGLGFPGDLYRVVRPIPYLAQIPSDVFAGTGPFPRQAGYFYLSPGNRPEFGEENWGHYLLASAGPDGRIQSSLTRAVIYDPTNGSASAGDVILAQKQGAGGY